MPTLKERLEGALLGLLIGDALGVPYEFNQPNVLPPLSDLEFIPPKGFHRSHEGVLPGTWSDDGAQALVLLASLLDCQKMDLNDFAKGLVDWYETGYMAVDGKVFDVGIQTASAIRKLIRGVKPEKAATDDEQSNGNGSLMRVLPLALWHKGSDSDLVNDAHKQSLVTHAHIRSQVCCALYSLWARRIIEGALQAWEEATTTLRQIYGIDSPETCEMDYYIRPDKVAEGQGSGYVVDCLGSARMVMSAGSYEAVVKAAVALGRDTDTTACVAGGIAGLRDGIGGIPERWLKNLRGKEIYEPELKKLIAWRTSK
ncbi:MAG: ADP-ribosylglycohydrolase family protein [Acidobacteria bacterium]|nr:ADP-ribosylglycohydrolase family protein [Acidobacteriota bacterium]